MKVRLVLSLILAIFVSNVFAQSAPWYKWRSTLNGKEFCAQTSPGEGWEKASGPYNDARCEKLLKSNIPKPNNEQISQYKKTIAENPKTDQTAADKTLQSWIKGELKWSDIPDKALSKNPGGLETMGGDQIMESKDQCRAKCAAICCVILGCNGACMVGCLAGC